MSFFDFDVGEFRRFSILTLPTMIPVLIYALSLSLSGSVLPERRNRDGGGGGQQPQQPSFEQDDFAQTGAEEEDLAVYTWGEDGYDGLGDALLEEGDDFNDDTFGGEDDPPVGESSLPSLFSAISKVGERVLTSLHLTCAFLQPKTLISTVEQLVSTIVPNQLKLNLLRLPQTTSHVLLRHLSRGQTLEVSSSFLFLVLDARAVGLKARELVGWS